MHGSSSDAVLGAMRALAVDAVTFEMVAALRAHGVRPILMKGAALRTWLYPDGGRTYGDVDLLVAPGEHPQARRVLTDRGWSPSPYPTPSDHALSFAPPAGHPPFAIDLHWTTHHVAVPAEAAWALLSSRTRTIAVGRGAVEVLAPTALAVVAALHLPIHADVPKHREDLRRAVVALDDEGWRSAAGLADALGALDVLAAALRHLPEGVPLADRLGLPVVSDARLRLRLSAPPETATALLGLWEARRDRAELRRRLASLVRPAPIVMHRHYPLARRRRGGMTAAYLYRPFHLARKVPSGVRAARSALRTPRDAS